MKIKIKKSSAVKWAFYTIFLCIIYALETALCFDSIFLHTKIHMIPFFIAAICMFEQPQAAIIFSCIAGCMCDAASISADGIMLLFYGLGGICIVIFANVCFRKLLISYMIMGSSLLLIKSFLSYAFYFFMILHTPFEESILKIVGGLFLSALFSPCIYFVIKHIHNQYSTE